MWQENLVVRGPTANQRSHLKPIIPTGLMAVTDIAEALTAKDWPYKKAMPLEQVYKILRNMVTNNELDRDLVEFFIKEKIYETYQAKYEMPDSPHSSESSVKNKKSP